jgi:tripartite-type tricarboxylate transporter receptor subunit TctC
MKFSRIAFAITLLAAVAIPSVSAQQFPSKPVKVTIPYSAGSGPDAVLRQVGDKLNHQWNQTLIVDNRPGGNGWIAIEAVKKSPADGYTLLEVDNSYVSLQPHLYKKLPYDPVKDLEPVAGLYSTSFFVVVPANSPWNSVADLIAAAKAKPGDVTYGTWGIGSVGHVGTAMLEAATGTKMSHVPFKDLGQLYAGVGNGDVNWAFGTAATAGPMYRAKKVKFLALAAPMRMAQYPDVPTVSESGGPPNYQVGTWVALYAPTGTPKPVVQRLNSDIAKALAEPDIREKLATFGFEPWIVQPAEVSKSQEADLRRFADVVKNAKISLD